MSFRRYEIILPTRYNDGAPVEQVKYWETTEEIVRQFGAVTLQPEILRGIWIYDTDRYEEENIRLFVDVEDTPESEAFFVRLKQKLKERFQQIDIWIVSYEVRIT